MHKTGEQLLLKSGNIDIRTTEKTNLLGVVLDSKLKFDDLVSSICLKVSAQINALNTCRLKNISPLKPRNHYIIVHATKFLSLQPSLSPLREKNATKI